MASEADAANRAANRAVLPLLALLIIEGGALFLGSIGLVWLAARWNSSTVQAHRFRPAFPPNTLLLAFAAYLATFLVIPQIIRLVLRPLRPRIEQLSETSTD